MLRRICINLYVEDRENPCAVRNDISSILRQTSDWQRGAIDLDCEQSADLFGIRCDIYSEECEDFGHTNRQLREAFDYILNRYL